MTRVYPMEAHPWPVLCLICVAASPLWLFVSATDPLPQCTDARGGLPACNFDTSNCFDESLGRRMWRGWFLSSEDNTTGPVQQSPAGGGYVFLTNAPRGEPGRKTRSLEAAVAKGIRAICVDVYYATSGTASVPLSFLLQETKDGRSSESVMHEVLASTSGEWKQTDFYCCLPNVQGDRNFVVRGTSDLSGMIAIDHLDIRVSNMTCDEGQGLVCYQRPPPQIPLEPAQDIQTCPGEEEVDTRACVFTTDDDDNDRDTPNLCGWRASSGWVASQGYNDSTGNVLECTQSSAVLRHDLPDDLVAVCVEIQFATNDDETEAADVANSFSLSVVPTDINQSITTGEAYGYEGDAETTFKRNSFTICLPPGVKKQLHLRSMLVGLKIDYIRVRPSDLCGGRTTENEDLAQMVASITRVAGRQTTPSTDTDDRQTILASETGDRQTTLASDIGDNQTTLASEIGNRQTSQASETGDRQTTLASETGVRQTILASETGDRQTTLASETGDRRTTLASETDDRQTILASEIGDRQTTLASETGDRQTTLASETDDRQTILTSETDDRQTILASETGDRQTTLASETGDRQTILTTLASVIGDRQTILASETGDRQTTLASEPGDRRTTLASETDDRQTTLASVIGDRQTILSSEVGDWQLMPSIIDTDGRNSTPSAEVTVTVHTPTDSGVIQSTPSTEVNDIQPTPSLEIGVIRSTPTETNHRQSTRTDVGALQPTPFLDIIELTRSTEASDLQPTPITFTGVGLQSIPSVEIRVTQPTTTGIIGGRKNTTTEHEATSNRNFRLSQTATISVSVSAGVLTAVALIGAIAFCCHRTKTKHLIRVEPAP